MSSVAPPQDAIAAASNKKKNKKAKKPKKPIDTNSKDGDGSTADQQPSPSPRDTNNNHDLSAGDDDQPSTPVVSTPISEAAYQLLVVESTTGSGDPPPPCGHELPSCIHSGTVLDRICIRTLFMKLFSAAIPELAQISVYMLGLASTSWRMATWL